LALIDRAKDSKGFLDWIIEESRWSVRWTFCVCGLSRELLSLAQTSGKTSKVLSLPPAAGGTGARQNANQDTSRLTIYCAERLDVVELAALNQLKL
jgi:hypothetical protein